ncbi:MAG: site-specific DNA-methyltransferase [Deltaproteobacteria bacterium]|jgi:adenine-specific DNA-methyltransferase|nr:site-specific DNA-methyltransferase [Deltaproteobacteria bacterium]
MERLKTLTPNLLAENIEKLKAIFPSCVVLVANDLGENELKVDFDRLRAELGDCLVFGDGERYRFEWPGKAAATVKANLPLAKTLRPDPLLSLNFNQTKNLFLEGDNLDILKLLLRSFRGKVKLIYIDPPYNTGSDLLYDDDFKESEDEYLKATGQMDSLGFRLVANTEANGRFHSAWLSFMWPRLKLARELLAEDGSIFISVDDHEVENLKKISLEIFGANNFLAQICVKGSGARQDSRHFAVIHSYVLALAKNAARFVAGQKREPREQKSAQTAQSLGYTARLLRKWGDKSRREDRPTLYYPIKDPLGCDHYPTLRNGEPGRWRWGPETMRRAILNDQVFFKKSHNAFVAYEKVWLKPEKVAKQTTWLDQIGVAEASGSLKELFHEKIFDYPKSLELIKIILSLGGVKDDDLVLDFFAGSATTGHAVMAKNAEEGSRLRFILAQLAESVSPKSLAFQRGYQTVSQIGQERLRRASQKIRQNLELKSQEGDLFLDQRGLLETLDLGFRVLKVDSPGLIDARRDPATLSQAALTELTASVKADRSPLDLLFEALIALGLDLTCELKNETVIANGATYELWALGANDLVALLTEKATEELITLVAQKEPKIALFLAQSFDSDALALTARAIFARLSPNTALKTL